MTLYKFSVGAVLAVAMVGVLAASAIVFSSRDFQFGVAQAAPSTNGRIDFAKLDEIEREIAEAREQSKETRDQLADVQERIAAIERAEADANQARTTITSEVVAIEQRAGITGAANPAPLSQRINTLAGQANLSAEDRARVGTLASSVTRLAQQDATNAENADDLASLYEQRAVISAQVAESDGQIHELQRQVVPEREHYDRIRNEARSLQSLSVFGATTTLAQGHPSLLSTALVLLMGALGSLLYLFPAYLNRLEPVTHAEVFVRLIFGMCAALAVYVLANALASISAEGMVQTQLRTTSASLNPFTTSLIGIVAGVLSEDIAKWIQDRGRGIFTPGSAGAARPASAPPPAPSERAPTGGLVNNDAISG